MELVTGIQVLYETVFRFGITLLGKAWIHFFSSQLYIVGQTEFFSFDIATSLGGKILNLNELYSASGREVENKFFSLNTVTNLGEGKVNLNQLYPA